VPVHPVEKAGGQHDVIGCERGTPEKRDAADAGSKSEPPRVNTGRAAPTGAPSGRALRLFAPPRPRVCWLKISIHPFAVP
jgi:hypothetical protein